MKFNRKGSSSNPLPLFLLHNPKRVASSQQRVHVSERVSVFCLQGGPSASNAISHQEVCVPIGCFSTNAHRGRCGILTMEVIIGWAVVRLVASCLRRPPSACLKMYLTLRYDLPARAAPFCHSIVSSSRHNLPPAVPL